MPAIAALVVGIAAAAGALASGLLPIPFADIAATSASNTQPATASISQNARSPIEPVSDADTFNETPITNDDLSSAENQNTNIVHLSAENATEILSGRVLGEQTTNLAPFLSQFSSFLHVFNAYLAQGNENGDLSSQQNQNSNSVAAYPRYGGYLPQSDGTTALSSPAITGGTITDVSSGSFDALSAGTLNLSGALTGTDATFSGTLTAGTLAVSGVSSGGAITAPYFTATSTSATSTFAGAFSAASSAFNILQNGNVGIGTTTSNVMGANANSRVLSISGDGAAWNGNGRLELINPRALSSLAAGDDAGRVAWSMSNNLGLAEIGEIYTALDGAGGVAGYGGKLLFRTKDDNAASLTTRMIIDSAGNIGIGTTTPWGKLSITGSGTGTGLAFAVADSHDTPRFVIQDNGNVGIGTTSPGSVLSIQNVGNFVAGATSTLYYSLHVPTLTSSGRTVIGGNVPTGDDTGILVTRATTNPLSNGGSHGVRDESTYVSSGVDGGYASFDSIPVMSGSLTYSHLHSFQARPNFSGSTGVGEIAGSTFQLTQNGAGTATNVYGFKMSDALGAGPVTTQVGIWCDPLTRGASNYCIYSGSASLPSYFGGRVQFGTAPAITASGFTTYGAILTHDTTGNLLTNPNLTIVNGVLTMSSAAAAKVLASATNLQLESTSGNVLVRPGAATAATFTSSGSVGVGTTTPTAQLSTTGTVRFSNFGAGTLTTDASGNLSVSSDERLKTIDGAFTRGLADVLQLSPIQYHWNSLSGLDTSTQYAGFSAQNVQSAIPEAVGSSTSGYLTLQDRPLIAAAINAVKELASQITDILARLTTQEERNAAHEAQLAALEARVRELEAHPVINPDGSYTITTSSYQPSPPLPEPDSDTTATSTSSAIDATAASSSPTTASSTPTQQPSNDNSFNTAATSTPANDNASSASAAIVETAAVAI